MFFCFHILFLNIEASQISFRIYGGGSWADAGDLNKNIRGWSNYFKDRNQTPYSFGYDVKEIQSLWEGGAEVAYSLSSRFFIALGIEFLKGGTKGEMTSRLNQEQDYFYSPADFGTIFIDERSIQYPEYRLQCIPITLTLYYSFPFGTRVNFFLGCGGGYYSGKMTYREDYQYDFDYRDEKNLSGSILEFVDQYSSSGTYTEKSTCKAFGFHTRGGLELKIRTNIHLIIEGHGRWVNFSEWKGSKKDSYTWDHTWGYWGSSSDQGSFEEVEEGKLWLAEFKSDETGKSYPRFVFSKNKPVASSYSGTRPAKINLNGLSIRMGIRIFL